MFEKVFHICYHLSSRHLPFVMELKRLSWKLKMNTQKSIFNCYQMTRRWKLSLTLGQNRSSKKVSFTNFQNTVWLQKILDENFISFDSSENILDYFHLHSHMPTMHYKNSILTIYFLNRKKKTFHQIFTLCFLFGAFRIQKNFVFPHAHSGLE